MNSSTIFISINHQHIGYQLTPSSLSNDLVHHEATK